MKPTIVYSKPKNGVKLKEILNNGFFGYFDQKTKIWTIFKLKITKILTKILNFPIFRRINSSF